MADHERIHHVILNRESTTDFYIIQFLGKVIAGFRESIGVSDHFEITWKP